MTHRIKCFVSFSSADTNRRDVEFLISSLRESLGRKVDFCVYFEPRAGANLQKSMIDDLTSSQTAILLFTPDFKRIADHGIKSDALNQFLRIVDILEDRKKREMFLCIPILWRGDWPGSRPEYFSENHQIIDLRKFRAYGADDRAPYLTDQAETEVRRFFDEVVDNLAEHWQRLHPDQLALDRLVDKKLLEDPTIDDVVVTDSSRTRRKRTVDDSFFVKAERSGISIREFTSQYFTKTSFYNQLGRLHKFAFTGRKGSGKTTLLQVYRYQNRRRYFSPIDIQVNDWNLHYILGDLTFKQAQSDFNYTQEESVVFDFVWAIFLSFCLVRSLLETPKIDPNTVINFIQPPHFRLQFSKSRRRYAELFQLSTEFVKFFIQESIDQANTQDEGEFRRDLTNALTIQACTELLLGPSYSAIVDFIDADQTNRRFLFCLDRFDTEMQKYRKDTISRIHDPVERATREAREVNWIQSLVELIDNLRSPDYYSLGQEFYKIFGQYVDFCVPLPKDRIVEVQRRRRDSISGPLQEEILWQPLELLTLLRKRLQQVWEISDEMIEKAKHKDALERFSRCVTHSGRRMPNQTTIRISTAEYDIDLFLGVLRHTFFRPRDVMIYYSKIISYVEGLKTKKAMAPNPSAIKRIISRCTYRIVEEEFIGEFEDTFVNLREIIARFRGHSQILQYGELRKLVGDLEFRVFADEAITLIAKKIRALYEIGFLGLSAQGHSIGGFPMEDFAFYFINTNIAQALDVGDIYTQLTYAIHPVFIESLHLRTGGHKPVLFLTWDKVREWDEYMTDS